MPIATSNNQDTERHELKTCEGGFIRARRLTYGEKLQRQAMVSNFRIQAGGKSKDFQGEMNLANEQATLFDFQRCIVDHNLERPGPGDGEPVKLDLGNVNDIRQLDPRIGEEIDTFLSKLNNFEEDDEGN